jgi:hypothetical protein
MSEQFAHGGGYSGEDKGSENGVCEGGGGEGNAAFASDASRTRSSRLHGDVGCGCCVLLGLDVNEIGHFSVLLVVLGWRVDWPCWALRSGYWRVFERIVVVVGLAVVVPVCEDVKVEFDLYFFYYVFVTAVVMVMVVISLYLGVCGCVFTCSGLDLL